MKEKSADKSTEQDQDNEKGKERERSSKRDHDRDRKDVSNMFTEQLTNGGMYSCPVGKIFIFLKNSCLPHCSLNTSGELVTSFIHLFTCLLLLFYNLSLG